MLVVKISLLIVFSLMTSSQSLQIGEIEHNITCSDTSKYNFVRRSGTFEYYMIYNILLNWFDAELYCQKFGSHLPSISNQSDLDFLRS
jgi:hypothetical protein